MKKILFIATSDIFSNTGGGIANRALLKALEEKFPNNVDVILPDVAEERGYPYLSHYYPVPELSISKKFFNFCKGSIHRYRKYVEDFLSSKKGIYSHCIINTGILGDLVPIIKNENISVAVVHHNLELEFQIDNKKSTTLGGLTSKFVRRNEELAYKSSDCNLFLTLSDRDGFRKEYGKVNKSEGVIGIFEPADFNGEMIDSHSSFDPSKLVICGSLDSVQTERGIRDFRDNYFDILARFYDGNYSLTITGRNPSKLIKDFSSSNSRISLVPNPEDISSIVSQSSVFMCPTNVGGGIKLRIIDGLKLGMPIITHKVSARGYDCFWGEPWFLVYDSKETFLESLEKVSMLKNSTSNIRQEIFQKYVDHFSYTCGKDRLYSVLTTFLYNH